MDATNLVGRVRGGSLGLGGSTFGLLGRHVDDGGLAVDWENWFIVYWCGNEGD